MTDAGSMLSEHLTLGEATVTQNRDPEILAAQGNPSPTVRQNLLVLARDIFEPARALVGPMRVNSGYRCKKLNDAIGGSATSAHMDGRALDLFPVRMSLRDAFVRIVNSGIPYDQAIYEYGRWIHLGSSRHGAAPRRQALMYFGSRYEQFDPNDPRVRGVETVP